VAPTGRCAAPVLPSDAAAAPDHPAPPVGDPSTLLQRLARQAAAHADPALGADALVHLAAARTRRDDDTAALAAATAALDLADRTGDPVLLGRATHRLAAALAAAADPGAPGGAASAADLREARTAFDVAVELLAGRDDAAHAHALTDRARLARRRDRPAEALADLHAALALYRTLGLPADVAAAWQEVAAVERATGNPCRAVAAHRSALAALAEAGDPTARAWTRLAAGLVQVGELPEGARADLLAARLADSPAARSVRELRELDPAAPDWALVVASTGHHAGGE
jgi:tetratricopeptide (TPR) repeat protein